MEVEFLKPLHYLAVGFQQGPVFFKITGREIIRHEPYEVGKVDAGKATDWFTPEDQNGNRLLEAEDRRFILHTFIGVDPEVAELYLDFPPRTGRFNLRGTRPVPGNDKWIDGVTSPFNNPSEASELISMYDLYPTFSLYNAGDEDIYAMLSFHVAKYTYRIVDDTNTIRRILEGKEKCKIYTFLEPYKAPSWLVQLVGSDLLDYAASLWNSVLGKNPNI